MADLGAQADVLGAGERLAEGLLLGVVGRVVGLVAAREVGPDAGHPPPTLGLACAGGLHEVWPVVEGRSAAGQPGVDLELEPGRSAAHGGADLVELGGGVGGDVDVRLDGGAPVVPGHRQPAQDAARVARRAQPQSLVDGGDPEPGGTGRAGCGGGLEHAVAVAVGLDHDHHVGPVGGDQVAQGADVGPDRGEVHHDLGTAAHGAQCPIPAPADRGRPGRSGEKVGHHGRDRGRHGRGTDRTATRRPGRGGAVQPRPDRPRVVGRQAGGQQGPAEPAQHVAGTRDGQPRRCRRW